nr:MAG TPA: hypothetical protein [Caudoviricetes sp.]
MVSYESINSRLGFDFVEKFDEYWNALVNNENENDNDHDLCPLKFLTWEEREFVENDFKKKFSNGQQ